VCFVNDFVAKTFYQNHNAYQKDPVRGLLAYLYGFKSGETSAATSSAGAATSTGIVAAGLAGSSVFDTDVTSGVTGVSDVGVPSGFAASSGLSFFSSFMSFSFKKEFLFTDLIPLSRTKRDHTNWNVQLSLQNIGTKREKLISSHTCWQLVIRNFWRAAK